MRTHHGLLALALLAATSTAGLEIVLLAAETSPPPLQLDPAADVVIASATELEAGPRTADAPVSTRTVALPAPRPFEPIETGAPKHQFDVTFVPVDDLGRPVSLASIDMGLVGQRLNHVGNSSWIGENNFTWKGAQPVLDACVRSTARSTHSLVSKIVIPAGRPVVVRIPTSGPFGERPDAQLKIVGFDPKAPDESAPASHMRSVRTAEFEVDSEGRGVFVDPDVLAKTWKPGETMFFSGGMGCGGSGGMRKKPWKLEVTVRDETGRAIAGVPFKMLARRGANAEGKSDDAGQITLGLNAPDMARVFVGGGERMLVNKDFDASEGVERWDILLPLAPSASGQLVDASGAPLGGWIVQAHDTDELSSFLASVCTDEMGRFAIGVPREGAVELRVRPRSQPWAPAARLSSRFQPGLGRDHRIVVRDTAIVSAIWHIDLPHDLEGSHPEARLVRLDTCEGAVVKALEVGIVPGGRQRYTFRADNLLAGDYELEIFAPGGAPSGSGRIRIVRAEQDLGGFAPGPGARFQIPESDVEGFTGWCVTVWTLRQGMLTKSERIDRPRNLVVADGDYELRLERWNKPVADAPIIRRVRAERGVLVDIPFDRP